MARRRSSRGITRPIGISGAVKASRGSVSRSSGRGPSDTAPPWPPVLSSDEQQSHSTALPGACPVRQQSPHAPRGLFPLPSVPSSLAAGPRLQRPLNLPSASAGPCPPHTRAPAASLDTLLPLLAPVSSTPGPHSLSPGSSPCLAGVLKENPLGRRVPVPDGCGHGK